MSEHKPDPEFVEYMESQVKNPFLRPNVVMQMERVFIDQREKYLHQVSKLQEDYEQAMHRVSQLEAMLSGARMGNKVWEKTMMEVIGEDGPASVADAIRALQDQVKNSIPKCDGNHGGAPCRDRECWNDEVVAAAEVRKFGYGKLRTTLHQLQNLDKYPAGTKLFAETPPPADIVAESQFLVERLRSFERNNLDDESFRDWNGHVCPSIRRLELLLDRKTGVKGAHIQEAGQ